MKRIDLRLNLKPPNLTQEAKPRQRTKSQSRPGQAEFEYLALRRADRHGTGLNLTESEHRQLMLRLEELARIEGLRKDYTRIKISAATQALIDSKAAEDEVLKHDGSVPLSDDWDAGDGKRIKIGEIRARNSDGLRLCDDDGSGVFVRDGGFVGIGTVDPDSRIDILDSSGPQLRLTHTDGSIYTEFQTDSNGHLAVDPTGGELNLDAIIDYTAAMGDSSKDPTSDAPDDWLEVKIGGVQRFLPCYSI